MVESLKFSAALPEAVGIKTLAERFANRDGAARVATELEHKSSTPTRGIAEDSVGNVLQGPSVSEWPR
jgi:hypothetical protein